MKKRNKKWISFGAVLCLFCTLLIACGQAENTQTSQNNSIQQNSVESNTSESTLESIMSQENTMESVSEKEETESIEETENNNEDTLAETVRIGSLKGPTSMGLLFLMDSAEKGEAANNYTFHMATGADELLPLMIKGELDIALLPANVASILYHKTEGGVSVININTLGVLYMVSGDTSIESIADLKDKTIYLTGKGTTPDYVLQYLLAENGLSTEDCTLEYKSEATEVAALLAENPDALGLLPQPFVTAACGQNEALSVIFDMNEEWNKVQGENGSSMVTGVTVVRNEFLEENSDAVMTFLAEHKESTDAINADAKTGAVFAVEKGIIANEALAEKAIPKCNITCVTGAKMKQALSGYLEVLYQQDASSIGGNLPAEEFYNNILLYTKLKE